MNEYLDEAEMLRRLKAEETLPAVSPYLSAKIWARIEPELQPYRQTAEARWWRSRFSKPAWLVTAAALCLLSFVGGRLWEKSRRPQSVESARVIAGRILLTAAADHLERSQRFLVELQMEPRSSPELAHLAQDLLDDNRLYLQSAAYARDAALTDVLDRLGRVLTEVAHGETAGGGVPGLAQGDWRLKDLAKAIRVEQRRSPLRA